MITMKKLLIVFCVLISTTHLFAAVKKVNIEDSLRKIEQTNDYKIKIATYVHIADYYDYLKGDSAMFYYSKAEKLSIENKYFNLMPDIYNGGASVLNTVIGNYPMALYYSF